MLRRALYVSWRDDITIKELYGDLPKITTRMSKMWLQVAGLCMSQWQNNVRTGDVETHPAGHPTKTFEDLLHQDTGFTTHEIVESHHWSLSEAARVSGVSDWVSCHLYLRKPKAAQSAIAASHLQIGFWSLVWATYYYFCLIGSHTGYVPHTYVLRNLIKVCSSLFL